MRVASTALLLLLTVCRSTGSPVSDREIVIGERVGPIERGMTLTELSAALGDAAVVPGDVYVGEGFCAAGARVFPDPPDEVEVLWTVAGGPVAIVRVSEPTGEWVTSSGITIGTPIEELERMNDGPLSFSGFGWDYGGLVSSWDGGRLAESHDPSTSISITLAPGAGAREAIDPETEARAVFGEALVRSDYPAIRKMDVTVVRLDAVLARLEQSAIRECEGS